MACSASRCAMLRWAAFAAAVVGWILYCSGVGSLHSACWEADLPWPARQAMSFAAGLVPFESCAWTYGWYWFLTFLDFCVVNFTGLVLSVRCTRPARPAAMVLLAVVTTLLIESGRLFLNMHYQLPNGMYDSGVTSFDAPLTSRAAKAALAGAIIVSSFNFLLILCLGVSTASDTACCAKKAEEQGAGREVSAPTAQAFISAVERKGGSAPIPAFCS